MNPFYIVDVFAETKYAGNPLAVVTSAGALSDEEMQQIAREMNYSETTFVLSDVSRDGGYDVRIFTPIQELPFAGHPTLGTAFVLQQEIVRQPVETIVLNLKVGQIPVTIEYCLKPAASQKGIGVACPKDLASPEGNRTLPTVLWMRQTPPVFQQPLTAEALAAVLQVNLDDIDSRSPIQAVSTGVPFMIVPLKTLQALQRIEIDRDRYFSLIETTDAKAILAFCPETRNPKNHLSVRVFAEALGVPEDPATGSANGCLAGYLVRHRYCDDDAIDLRVEQGYEIDRPSLLLLKAQAQADEIVVQVGGRAIAIAKGELI